MSSSSPPITARTKVPPPQNKAVHHFVRSLRRSSELAWTVGLDLQRAWGIRPASSRRAAPAYIHSSSSHP